MPALRTRDTHPAARPLEVSTSAPPPSLTIISPTPRAFTFPIAHNLSDSPYSSPSNSPFEPDLRALALSSSSTPTSSVSSHNDECRTPPPLSAFTRTLSPASASSPPPAAPAPIRRKSTSAAAQPDERRPKKGDEDYVKRPENAFILFRRKCCEDRALGLTTSVSAPSSVASAPSSADSPSLAPGKKQRQADLSKTISQQWKALSPEERSHWEALAKEKKREHETLHPNYVYRPQRSSAKNRAAAAAASSSAPTTATAQRRKHSAPPPQQVEFVVPTPRGQHSRSASAPTPPPYQAIQIPNVYFGSSSSGAFAADGSGDSPTSLMPMISRRGVGNGSGGFDYLPTFQGAFDFEASLQSSDFLRSMFQTLSPTSPPSTGAGGIMSPASSASGSGPSSPYTPASASFHPSAFSASYAPPAAFSPPTDSSYSASSDMGLGLEEPAIASGTGMEPDYASYASAWMAASPWGAAPPGAGLAEGDFDIGRIPEIGWELGCAAFPAAQPAFPGGAYEGGEMHEFGEQGVGEPGGLDMHFGEMGMGEMGFDEMMAGQGF
ncbi:hypothetical protein DFH07DRAFT_756234 [Mycena maculata]|uniref:HMG box domain-containing protein n=1 Tax=Mycena maculata TaxID=230809 RepID=A0AAD7HZ61_9AGAR|nr:hypothetical protein DFH07DRAFT_756234 [Mycena maculata]